MLQLWCPAQGQNQASPLVIERPGSHLSLAQCTLTCSPTGYGDKTDPIPHIVTSLRQWILIFNVQGGVAQRDSNGILFKSCRGSDPPVSSVQYHQFLDISAKVGKACLTPSPRCTYLSSWDERAPRSRDCCARIRLSSAILGAEIRNSKP